MDTLRVRSIAMRVLVALLGWTSGLSAGDSDAIHYTITFPEDESHYIEVVARYPVGDREEVELMLPVWTPGSYLVREYSRFLEGLTATATDGSPLPVVKVRKNRWRVVCGTYNQLFLRYRVYCHNLSVRGNWVDQELAILNGAGTFITMTDALERAHEVTLVPRPGWRETVTGLPRVDGGSLHAYHARDYDTLVDSPIYAGNPAVYRFEVDQREHLLVHHGEGGIWDGPRSALDVEKIVRTHRDFWGGLPYDRYVFLNMITERGGGLEHANSTLIMTSRWNSRDPKQYRDWLGLVSHEFFHTWNVKRLRPVELQSIDYENEVYTENLWVVEGLTSYYDDLLVRRAGLLTDKQYLEALSSSIKSLQTTPGRLEQSLARASYDTWIKFYREHENSRNTTISYYVKGAVAGFLLDARIRRSSGGQASLDDVMRALFSKFSGDQGYTFADFERAASTAAGEDLSGWLERVVFTTEELEYAEALDLYGLCFKASDEEENPDEKNPDEKGTEKDETTTAQPESESEPASGWLGIEHRDHKGRLVVTRVDRGTPGHDSGLQVDDEIIALDEYRVLPGGWDKRLDAYRPGDRVELLVARRERLLTIALVLGEKPEVRWQLELVAEPTEEQRMHRAAWLGHCPPPEGDVPSTQE